MKDICPYCGTDGGVYTGKHHRSGCVRRSRKSRRSKRPGISIRISTRSVLTYSPDALRHTGRCHQLPLDSWNFLECLVDESATHAVEATCEGELVGWLRVSLIRKTLFAQGTWVSAVHRRQGIAKALWQRALETLKPRVVEVSTVSEEGRALVRRLVEQHTGTTFDTAF